VKKHPLLSAVTDTLASRPLVRLTRAGVDLQQRRRYGRRSGEAEVSPWRIIWIDPRTVDEIAAAKGRIYPQADRVVTHVLDGDWDQDRSSFWSGAIHRAIRDRIVHGTRWEDTEFVIRLSRVLAEPDAVPQWHGCRTPTDVLARCARIDRLIGVIADHGYRPPAGIGPGVSGLATEYPPDAVSVGITREGQILHLNGKHRFAIASSLGLSSIPVRVGLRHATWQARRNALLAGGTGAEDTAADHPDVAFLLPGVRTS